jgi:hypothetical protein
MSMTLFLCTQCQIEKPLTDFYLNAKSELKTPLCKACYSDRYYKTRYELKDPTAELGIDLECRYCGKPFQRIQRRAKAYCSRECKNADRRYSKHGLTKREHDAMLIGQDGCAICHTHEPGQHGWAIDHDHKCCDGSKYAQHCGKCVRGILCGACNMGIGQLGDSPERLNAAATYLRSSAR